MRHYKHQPIVIKYDWIIDAFSQWIFHVKGVDRAPIVNKCSVIHDKDKKTLTIDSRY